MTVRSSVAASSSIRAWLKRVVAAVERNEEWTPFAVVVRAEMLRKRLGRRTLEDSDHAMATTASRGGTTRDPVPPVRNTGASGRRRLQHLRLGARQLLPAALCVYGARAGQRVGSHEIGLGQAHREHPAMGFAIQPRHDAEAAGLAPTSSVTATSAGSADVRATELRVRAQVWLLHRDDRACDREPHTPFDRFRCSRPITDLWRPAAPCGVVDRPWPRTAFGRRVSLAPWLMSAFARLPTRPDRCSAALTGLRLR
jgi:hypothetical protein